MINFFSLLSLTRHLICTIRELKQDCWTFYHSVILLTHWRARMSIKAVIFPCKVYTFKRQMAKYSIFHSLIQSLSINFIFSINGMMVDMWRENQWRVNKKNIKIMHVSTACLIIKRPSEKKKNIISLVYNIEQFFIQINPLSLFFSLVIWIEYFLIKFYWYFSIILANHSSLKQKNKK